MPDHTVMWKGLYEIEIFDGRLDDITHDKEHIFELWKLQQINIYDF